LYWRRLCNAPLDIYTCFGELNCKTSKHVFRYIKLYRVLQTQWLLPQERADSAVVLPPGAPAFAYAEHNIQASYVPPGNWEPSPEALQEAHAMSRVLESEEASAVARRHTCRLRSNSVVQPQTAGDGMLHPAMLALATLQMLAKAFIPRSLSRQS